jgi:Mn-containing catalase
MILRLDRIAAELPPPSDPDPAGAAAVQELMGGRFGEMSTFMNYTFQSFNFRDRKGARPFYDLIANIAGEEFGHIELVAATINTMLTGATPTDDGKAPSDSLVGLKGIGNPHHFVAGGQGALPQNSQGRPWNGDYVFSSGDLVEDLTHNFFLETGARNNKLKVYEMVEHPAARALTGYLLVRGGVHQVAYARALENLTGANLMQLFPSPRIPTDKIPECRPHIERGDHLRLYRFSPNDYLELAAVFNGPHPETGEELMVIEEAPEGAEPNDLPSQPAVFAPDYAPEEIAEIAKKLRERAGLSKQGPGVAAKASALVTDALGARLPGGPLKPNGNEITNSRELFLHELGDILFVERQLAETTLPQLIDEVVDREFRTALEKHLKETRMHVANVEKVFKSLGEEPQTEECIGFLALKEEHAKLKSETSPGLIDTVDLGAAARTEGYEIAAYETLRRMAKGMGETKAVELLDANLKEEKEALRQVEKIATRVSNESAKESASA